MALVQVLEPKTSEMTFWVFKIALGRLYEHSKLKKLDPQDEAQCAFFESRIMDEVSSLVHHPSFKREKRLAITAIVHCVDGKMEDLPKAKPYKPPKQKIKVKQSHMPPWGLPLGRHPTKGKMLPKDSGE